MGGNGSGEIRDFDHFLLWEHASRDAIMVKRVYIDMAGDVIAGLMLSQIVYWHLPNDEGKTRLRVEVDGYLWLVKGYGDWWDECRLTFKQARRAVEMLQEKGLIITCNRKFGGAPRLHIRIEREAFLNALNRFALQGKSTCPTGQIHMPPGANPHALQGKSYKQTLRADTTTDTTAATGSTEYPKQQRRTSGSAAALEEDNGPIRDAETACLIKALIAAQLNQTDAWRLATVSPDECRRQLEYLPFKTGLENPGAYLRSAIEGAFSPPREYLASKAQEERERKKRDEAARREAIKATKMAHEAAEAARIDANIRQLETETPEAFQNFLAHVQRKKDEQLSRFAGLSTSAKARLVRHFDTPEKRRELFVEWQGERVEGTGAISERRRQHSSTAPVGP